MMKGLLLKDILNLKQQGKIYLAILGVWLLVSFMNKDANFFASVMMIFAAMLPMSAVAYDEKAKWDSYALTMPFTKNDLVLSKYLLALIGSLVGSIVSLAVGLLLDNEFAALLTTVKLYLSIGMIIASIVLPFIFKLGAEKGRLIIMLMFIIPSAFVMIITKINVPMPNERQIMFAIDMLPFIALVIVVVSIMISQSIYNRKEF